MYRKIIVGFDGSETARDALALGTYLAKGTHAELNVAYAFPYEALMNNVPRGVFRENLLRDADHTLAGARAALDEAFPGAEYWRLAGSPAKALHNLAESEPADLIIVGSSHRGAIGRALAGSTAEKLLHGASCAVAVAPRGFRYKSDEGSPHVGVAYNGSDEGREALKAALAIAREHQGSVRLIDVVDLAGMGLNYGYGYAEYVDSARGKVRDEIAQAANSAGSETIETEIHEGMPATEIIAASEKLDLLVVGSRGYGPARRALLGSVSARLINEAACPVIVVPRGAHVRPSSSRETSGDLAATPLA